MGDKDFRVGEKEMEMDGEEEGESERSYLVRDESKNIMSLKPC